MLMFGQSLSNGMTPKVDPTGLQQSLWWLPGCQVAISFEGPFRGVSIGGRMRCFHTGFCCFFDTHLRNMPQVKWEKYVETHYGNFPVSIPKKYGSKTDHRPPPNYKYIIGIQCFETSQSLFFCPKRINEIIARNWSIKTSYYYHRRRSAFNNMALVAFLSKPQLLTWKSSLQIPTLRDNKQKQILVEPPMKHIIQSGWRSLKFLRKILKSLN